MRNKIMKIILGSIYTVITISVITALLFGMGGSVYMPRFEIMQIGALASAIVALAFVIFWGIPSHLIFLKLKINTIKWYALSGFLAGPLFVFITKPFGDDPFFGKLIQSAYCGVIGLLGAIVFWWFVVKNNSHNKAAQSDA